MTFSTPIATFLLFGMALVQRLAISLHTPTGFDTYGHLYYARCVKEQRIGIAGDIAIKVVSAEKFSHPFLWHWLISRLPMDWVIANQRLINPAIDAVVVGAAYAIARRLGAPSGVCLTAALVYIWTPLWFTSIAIGPRIASLTPRLLSEIVTNLYFVALLVPLAAPAWARLATAAACGAFVLMSSKFGMQALIFLSLVIAGLTLTWWPLLTLFFSFALCLLFSGRSLFRALRTQYEFLAWYIRKHRRHEMPISSRLDFSFLRPRRPVGKWLRSLPISLIATNAYTSTVLKLPVLPLSLMLLMLPREGSSSISRWLVGAVLGAVIVFAAINTPALLILGEGERYLNHVAFFICVLAADLATTRARQSLVTVLLVYGGSYWCAEALRLYRKPKSLQKAERSIIDALRDLAPTVVLLYPSTRLGAFRVMLETHHKVIELSISGESFRNNFEAKYGQEYPYCNLLALDDMSDEIGIGALVCFDEDLSSRHLDTWQPSRRWQPRDVGGPFYRVYFRN
jgi:hypothetical protein